MGYPPLQGVLSLMTTDPLFCSKCDKEIHLIFDKSLDLVICCGFNYCIECWNEHDVEKHDYPEVPDEY